MIDKLLNRIFFIALLLFVASMPLAPLNTQAGSGTAALVECGGTNPDGTSQGECTFADLLEVLHNTLDLAIWTLAPIFVAIMVVMGGFFILTAGPNPGRKSRGMEIIKWAVIGYAIIMLSWIIVNTVLQMLGVATWTGLSEWWDIQI